MSSMLDMMALAFPSLSKGSIRVPAREGLREALQMYAVERDGPEASVSYADFASCIFRIAEKEEGGKKA
jgi:hypothetical protein